MILPCSFYIQTDLCLQLLLLPSSFFQRFGDFCAHHQPAAQLRLRKQTTHIYSASLEMNSVVEKKLKSNTQQKLCH